MKTRVVRRPAAASHRISVGSIVSLVECYRAQVFPTGDTNTICTIDNAADVTPWVYWRSVNHHVVVTPGEILALWFHRREGKVRGVLRR
jgi:hypothetical protein